jgi:oligosaccharyltransferase complex subunit alpha (ribophorin I)
VTQLEREFEVSHWGANLAVKEDYALTHDGAKLIQEFSRNQYRLAPHILDMTNVFNRLIFKLPHHAKDVYYRDEVGNVSTSNFFKTETTTEDAILEIKPRFPLFGGWKTTWNIGYNVRLKDYLRYHKGGYTLKVQFIENAQDMSFDHVKVKVILPEGAA